MSDCFRFKKFKVYQDAKLFYLEIIQLISKFSPKHYNLIDQIKRASLSVILNIAEGSAKKSDKDFSRYLKNSLGSINETVACLDLLLNLNLINSNKYLEMEEKALKIANQLGGFSKKLNS